jgi:hypothetical protein
MRVDASTRTDFHTPVSEYSASTTRLINTSTLTIHEFLGKAVPEYAILSHTWEDEEVTFQVLQAGKGPTMKGFGKIKGCCQQAVLDGWNYAWIDTCCIDKTSSAELSEAINSMFEWYNESRVCYAYLSDVHYTALEGVGGSKWWTRGWTLQELIAPRNLIFYDAEWREIGTKRSLEVLISSISGISREHLHDYATASVAQKMSWASKRKTTRKEDEAYCLMGIFNLHMPLLYWEGGNAFRRLQLEILANSDDESILAWTTKPKYPTTGKLLAISSAAFYDAGGIVEAEVDKYRPPFSMTNKGLRIEFFLLHRREDGKTLAPLNCVDTRKWGNIIALSLFKMGTRNKDTCDNRYHRGSKLHDISETPRFRGRRTAMFLTNEERTCAYMSPPIAFCIRTDSLLRHGFTAVQEHVYDSCMKIETREVSRPLKGEGGLKVVLSSEGAFVK